MVYNTCVLIIAELKKKKEKLKLKFIKFIKFCYRLKKGCCPLSEVSLAQKKPYINIFYG